MPPQLFLISVAASILFKKVGLRSKLTQRHN
jgi:hypothetical protein